MTIMLRGTCFKSTLPQVRGRGLLLPVQRVQGILGFQELHLPKRPHFSSQGPTFFPLAY